jgi:succinylglutamic semialdehyde dehydrogenase
MSHASHANTANDLYIRGEWHAGGGEPFSSTDPATSAIVWSGLAASAAQVDRAVAAARDALPDWTDTPLESRVERLNAFGEQLKTHRDDLALCISREVGKPRWEALTEVDAMVGKIALSVEALHARRAPAEKPMPGGVAATRYKPVGVVAVFGPFNFPGHLPNGHIVPALLAGNTVVFKPSELSPLVARRTVELWHAAGLPPGVLNLVQGGGDVGAALAAHAGLDGLYFTGSARVGLALSKQFADQPGKVLALELGGNNPLIVHGVADVRAAAYMTVQSAYITAGQRCTCARRLIVPRGAEGDAFVDALVAMARNVAVGSHTQEPEPFTGPVITAAAAEKLLAEQASLASRGGRLLLEMRSLRPGTGLLSPGLIDVTDVPNRPDEELFGPLLQLIRVPDVAAAITEANATRFGLAAGLLSDDAALYRTFFRQTRAGVVNWNRPLTGASGALPFGGVGLSGNGRPSGFFAADYCSYPVASLESPVLMLPKQLSPGVRV